jgi:hypothetical protein
MAKRKYIETPEKLWELYTQYKDINNEISREGFELFCKKTIGNVKMYFSPSIHKEFNDIVLKIKDDIFKHKFSLYKKGLLHHQKICKEAKNRGLNISESVNFIGKTDKNQFVIENGIISIKDNLLKKKSHTAKILISNKIPDTIYILNIEGTNIYKIGTSQNVNRRIKDICASNPFHIDIIHIQKVKFAYEVEQSIHNEIDNCHIKNEWFKIKDIDKIIDIIKNS